MNGNYIKLMAMPHSGSTLLALILGSHARIATVGELAGRTHYDGYQCSCGKVLVECDFWREIARRMEGRGHGVDLSNFGIRLGYIPAYSRWDGLYDHYFPTRSMDLCRDLLFVAGRGRARWIDGVVEKNLQFAETITDYLGKDHFFDSTKDIVRVRHLIPRLGSKFKVIHLVRDGRGVVNSLIKREKRTGEQAVAAWRWGNRMIGRVLGNHCPEETVHRVSYEALCSETEKTVNGILSFVGASPDFTMAESVVSEHHIIGNQMRKRFNGRISLDEKWRKELPREDLALFMKAAGRKNRELGYD